MSVSSSESQSSTLTQGVINPALKGVNFTGDTSTLRGGLVISTRLSPMKYYQDAIEFGNLYKGLKKSCKNVRWKDSVVGYEANALRNTYNLRQDLLNGKYKISPYQTFQIHEPKERTIVATRIRDRQFQRALCDAGFYKDMVDSFITDNPACQKEKGTTYTHERMIAHLRKYNQKYGNKGWVLKCDIHHFFPTTSHEVAKAAVRKNATDPDAIKAVCDVIDSFEGDCGIGLGSQISQLVELAVLNDLDHYIKEVLRVKHYVRYMDDFVLFHPDKAFLQNCLKEIQSHVEALGLKLNGKTTIYPLSQGIKMIKWRFVITDSGRILQLMDKKKPAEQRKKLAKLWEKEQAGQVAKGTTQKSLEAWLANADRGDTYMLQQKMKEYYRNLTKGGKGNE